MRHDVHDDDHCRHSGRAYRNHHAHRDRNHDNNTHCQHHLHRGRVCYGHRDLSRVISTQATETETETDTITSTVQAPCATNNFADFFDGIPVIGVDPIDPAVNREILPGGASPEDCCNWALGIQDDNSATNLWSYLPSSDQCTRYYAPGAPCDNNQLDDIAALVVSEAEHPQPVGGNGYCGLIIVVEQSD
jgi:hypothetical protein